MSAHFCHSVSRHCDHAQSKIHTVAELLLLSGSFRPIKSENTSGVQTSLAAAREQILSSLNIVQEIIHDLSKSTSDFKNRWKTICDMLYRLSDAVTVLVELCYHVTYQSLVTDCNGTDTTIDQALVDRYATSYAGLEIKLSCLQLRRARLEELSGSFIMDICSNISKYISLLTDNCRQASEHAADSATRDQFKLGIKSVTCAAGSLIASIKSYKGDKSARHHARVVTFCEPVLAASHALVCLATEEEFIDKGRPLTDHSRDVQKAVFGPCMNIVSGCVQVCKVLRDFTYDTSNPHYAHKMKSCQNSVIRSTNQLKLELQKHFQMDFQMKSPSPATCDQHNLLHSPLSQTSITPTENHQDLSPFARSSPLPGDTNIVANDDHSPRSSLAPSDSSFSTSSLSR